MIVDLVFSGGAEFCDPPDRDQLSGLHQIRAQYRSEWGPRWVPAGQEVSVLVNKAAAVKHLDTSRLQMKLLLAELIHRNGLIVVGF